MIPKAPGGRLAHLDGLRGSALVLVLAAHVLRKAGSEQAPVSGWLAPLFYGDLGVLIFFVLSGFLITSILAREQEHDGRLNLSDFYIRRSLRIWPALWVFVAALAVLATVSNVIEVAPLTALSAVLFVQPYGPADATGGWWLGHTWSLSVEFIFYALWPLVLHRFGARVALKVAVAIVICEPLLRIAHDLAAIGPENRIPNYFHTRVDALMAGAIIALLPIVVPGLYERFVALVARWRLELVALAGMALSAYLTALLGDRYQFAIGWTLEAACAATLIVAMTRECALRRVMALRVPVVLGLISYSTYLWQQVYLAPAWHGAVLGSVPLALALSLLTGLIGYRFVELPFLRLKKRFEGIGERGLLRSETQAAG